MKDNIPTLAFADVDAVVSRNLTRALKDEFDLTVFSQETKDSSEPVDLIIFDLEAKDGLGQLETLRKIEPAIPILILGSFKYSSVLEQALDLSDVDFLTKPIDTKELKLRARRLLRAKKYIDEIEGRASLLDEAFTTAEKRGRVLRNPKVPIEVSLTELHGKSGRLDASAFAHYLAVPLAKVAEAIGVNYASLHKTPDSPAAQPPLEVIKRILVVLSDMLGKRETVLAWLNSPHPNLGNRKPLVVILEGHADAVLTILENARAGVPS